MFRPRGITTKLAVIFLVIGIIPMATVGILAYYTARDSMTRNAVEFLVTRVARDTAQRIDLRIRGIRRETEIVATSEEVKSLVDDYRTHLNDPERSTSALALLQQELDRAAGVLQGIDLFVIVDPKGEVMLTSSRARKTRTGPYRADRPDRPVGFWDGDAEVEDGPRNPLAGRSLASRVWWPAASNGESTFIDWGVEPLVQRETYAYPLFLDSDDDKPARWRLKNPEAFSFGYALAIPMPDAEATPSDRPAVLIAFYNWSVIQDILDGVDREFKNHERYPSAYTFLFKGDLDSIIGHKDRRNYRTSLTHDHGIVKLYDAMQRSESGVCEYNYPVKPKPNPKISGFSAVPSTGWRLGFGINNEDIFAEVARLRDWLLVCGLVMSGVIAILIAWVSRRATEPIRTLIAKTGEIARGNLDARIPVRGHDEFAVLMDAFNKMAEDLKALNKRIIQAEKTAAWREMARQVAHEIKNPLTPMKLAAQLAERAYADGHPDFGEILKTSVRNIVSQIESLRRIASDFSNYAALPERSRKSVSIRRIIEECTSLYAHRDAPGVEVVTDIHFDESVAILADRDEIKRVFLNLFNNAFDAMQDGGTLTVTGVRLENPERGDIVDLRVKDTGPGIDPEIADRLFEPYFTTRTSGTGLGLAICRQTIENHGGTIAIASEPGEGTTVIITLPVVAAPPTS